MSSRALQGVTEIKVLTDSALLREAQADPLFGAYSAIVIDDASARSADTDLLLGLLRKVWLSLAVPDSCAAFSSCITG